jgi:CubicO group peptidase (beta-lactamase class C family)
MVADARRVIWQTPRAPCPRPPGDEIVLCHPRDPAEQRWPWASVTKQVVAVLAMQLVEEGKLQLERPIDAYLPAARGTLPAPTVRQLLQHQSGLRNANESPRTANGFPSAYSTLTDKPGWCLADRKASGGTWQYNNCDYFVLDAVFKRVTGQSAMALFAKRIAKPLELQGAGVLPEDGSDEQLGSATARAFAGFGAGGGMAGTAAEMLAIDRALMAGTLLKPASRAILWEGNPKLGSMALGQWVFEAPLKGCARPVRIVERRGAIDTTQVRNIILPELGKVVIVFTANGEFDFGEIWQGKGFAYDLLSAAACP